MFERYVLAAIAGEIILITQPMAAAAHPHVWVTVETTIPYDNGNFTGLKQKWTFDQSYTDYAIEPLQKQQDGTYSRKDLTEIAKVNIEALKQVDYFTYPVLGDKRMKLKTAQDYWVEYKNGLLSLYFTVLFDQPISTAAQNFRFFVEDPTYFIAFTPAKVNPVKFGKGTPNSCNAQIGRTDANADLAKAFAQLATQMNTSSVVTIVCAGH